MNAHVNTTATEAAAAVLNSAAEPATENAAVFNPEQAQEMERVTVGEYLDMLDDDFVLNPSYQSGLRWDAKQIARLRECLLQGRAIPALIIARIPSADGSDVLLRIDGNQRTMALQAARDALQGEENAAALETLMSRSIWLQYVTCKDALEAASLFVDLNNGTRLSAAQKSKAALSEQGQELVNAFTTRLERANGKGVKWGKVNPDTAAAMLCTVVVNPDAASTSATSAAKAIAEIDKGGELPEYPAAQMDMLISAISLCNAADQQNKARYTAAQAAAAEKQAAAGLDVTANTGAVPPEVYGNKGMTQFSYWRSPAHLVPVLAYLMTPAAHGATKETLAAALCAFDPTATTVKASYRVKAGKGTKGKTSTVRAAWTEASNAKSATIARIKTFAAYMVQRADAVELDAETAEAADAIAALING